MTNVFISPEEAMNRSARFVDCRHLLTDPEWGYTQFTEEHITGAVFAHLDNDLSGEITNKTGRHPLPEISQFKQYLETKALSPDKTIIGYDNFNGGIAARLWWMLTQLGYTNVYIMTQGIERWKKSGGDVSSKTTDYDPISIDLPVSSWDEGPYSIATMSDIEDNINTIKLLDSRSPERYRGEEEPYDKIPGHIPGALNLYWESNINDAGQIDKSAIQSLDEFNSEEYTVYCGSGVTACFNLAVFEDYNLARPKYYPGSYSEWSRNNPELIE